MKQYALALIIVCLREEIYQKVFIAIVNYHCSIKFFLLIKHFTFEQQYGAEFNDPYCRDLDGHYISEANQKFNLQFQDFFNNLTQLYAKEYLILNPIYLGQLSSLIKI